MFARWSARQFARSAFAFVFILLCAASVIAQSSAPSEWKTVTIPDVWKANPGGEHLRLWYRCQVRIPVDWKGQAVSLMVEAVDDAREVYWNGHKIGTLGSLGPTFRSSLGETHEFPIPADKIRFGDENLIAIRVRFESGRTGFNVAAPILFAGEQAIRLAGAWEKRIGDDLAWSNGTTASKLQVFADSESGPALRQAMKKLQGDDGPLSPVESMARMTVPNDLTLELALSEPEVCQPLTMKWDACGRLWVVQYLQYPNPAGLTMVSRDKFLRSVYDKIPPAPPNHFPGADKITIHEDTDGDGKLDKHKSFVEGLSLASSFEFGRGGIWVLNPPYLLFYPDRDGDDVPDGDPVVHLEGFGIEDSHSVANHLRWGNDGWLYAAQGSTVTGNIKRPGDKNAVHSLGQLIWRYHPELRKYEIFAEGGGNTFGVEIDSKGRTFSGTNGGNTRGYHYVQGGYYQKGFGKHGALSNPFSFGYFEAMAHHNVPRFTHTFVIYEGASLPASYRGQLFGVGPLQGHVVRSDVMSDRSSIKTRDVGYLLESKDTWCRPVDIQVGPDGAIYVADMYEQRIDHASHYQGRIHKTSGRIYRLQAKDAPRLKPFNLNELSSEQLIELFAHENRWFREKAREVLMLRGDRAVAEQLQDKIVSGTAQIALEALWALGSGRPLDDGELEAALDHADPHVRLWAVRLACDDGQVSAAVGEKLADLAYRDAHVEVRSQLACSARRLPAAQSLAIVKNLASRSEDRTDIHIPLLLWWAIEAKAEKDRGAVVALFQDKAFWDQPLVSEHLVERVMRRYAATGARKDLLTCAELLQLAPSKEHAGRLMAGLEAAYEGRTLTNLPAELVTAMAKAGSTSPTLRLRQGDTEAVAAALKTIGDESADASKRQQLATLFGTLNQPTCVPVLLRVVRQSRNDSLRSAALASLQSYNDPSIGPEVVALYSGLPEQVRSVAQSLLASRAAWAELLLAAVDAGSIEAATIEEATVRKLQLHSSPRIAELCQKHWKTLSGMSPDELRAQVDSYLTMLSGASGNPYEGKKTYNESCGKCHRLFEQGGQIGPDLTAFKRDDLRGLLLNVVHPSAEIREGFEQYIARTVDGRTLSGFIADQDAQVVVLRGVDGQNLTLARDEIEELRAVPRSLMPEGILKPFSEQQVRDLFAYLRSTQPLP